MTKGHHWLAGPMREIGTETNEQTMEKLVMAAWKETEKEHKSYVTERIKRRNEKLNKAHSTNGKSLHQWVGQDCQTPIATMKRADGSITMNFQEIQQTLVESWRPILARWNEGEEPRYSDFEERFGRFIPNEPMVQRGSLEWNCVTQSNAGRTTRQLEQTHGRDVNGNNSRTRCTTRLQTT